MKMQAMIWYRQGRFEDARSEAMRADDACEKLQAVEDVEGCKTLIRIIEIAKKIAPTCKP